MRRYRLWTLERSRLVNRDAIHDEIGRRAEHHLAQTHLVTDYYRIRRKLAYPLPVTGIHLSKIPIHGGGDRSLSYPWATWMSWALEERVHSLGWAGEWLGDEAARDAVRRDIDALAQWPTVRQYDWPDLSTGHATRTLWAAYANWAWIGDETRARIESAFARIVDDVVSLAGERPGWFESARDVQASGEPHKALANIPIIGCIGGALAANAIGHENAGRLNRLLTVLMTALLNLREEGFSEGVAYNGYVMDFVLDWLGSLPEGQRGAILDHPNFTGLQDESIYLSAPGDAVEVPELSDVEPVEMPFHISAHAKTHAMRPDGRLAWYLGRCRFGRIRADGLAALHDSADAEARPPVAGALNAHYATVLRTGYESDDLAVAMSSSRSPLGHVHCDAGSIVIGTRGKWILTDPGYQQYMKTSEREFTLGPAAHNAPVIGGKAQDRKGVKDVECKEIGEGTGLLIDADLTDCYPPELALSKITRTVALIKGRAVMVADRIETETPQPITYHWHGHPDASWWVEDGWARVYLPPTTLWLTCPQANLQETDLHRLCGSRGQMTLVAQVDASASGVFWIFGIGDEPPQFTLEDGSRLSGLGGFSYTIA